MPRLRQTESQQHDTRLIALIEYRAKLVGIKNVEQLAPRVGMTERTLYNRYHAPKEFKRGELQRIFTALKFTDEDKLQCM